MRFSDYKKKKQLNILNYDMNSQTVDYFYVWQKDNLFSFNTSTDPLKSLIYLKN